jgi:hypothetical protein
MKAIEKLFRIATLICAALLISCPDIFSQARSSATNNKDVSVAYQTLDGICARNIAGTEISCDIYSKLNGWEVTEITVFTTWYPYDDDENARFFVVPVSIKGLQTERVKIRLGFQLPRTTDSFHWQILGAKGHRIQNPSENK